MKYDSQLEPEGITVLKYEPCKKMPFLRIELRSPRPQRGVLATILERQVSVREKTKYRNTKIKTKRVTGRVLLTNS